jgi:hypothetical protein
MGDLTRETSTDNRGRGPPNSVCTQPRPIADQRQLFRLKPSCGGTSGYISFLVHDYDEALSYFIEQLSFQLLEDTDLDNDKNWVLIAPSGSQETRILLAKAVTPEQTEHIGDQAGGRVFLFLHTDDF